MRIAISAALGSAALLLAGAAAADLPQAPPPAVSKAKDPASLDAPPPPPVPGLAPPPPAVGSPPVFTDAATAQVLKEPPLAGWHGGFFLRDPGDYFRLYPRGRLHLDFNSFPGAPTPAASGGLGLQPRFYAQSLRVELAGQFLTRWTFLAGVDFGGQPVSNPDGKSQQSAAPVGVDPTSATARYAQVQAVGPSAVIQDAYVNYSVCNCINFMAGQQDVAFSMENETTDNLNTFMARSIGVRSFAVPSKKELGLRVWGEILDGRLAYGLQVLAGDMANRPQIDGQVDFAGRVFARPLHGSGGALDKLQIGVSGRTGQRDPKLVGYDYPALVSGQGYSLWQPTYKDSLGRVLHVLPSGSQNEIGGEFRLPVSILDIRGEAYYLADNTREAVDGYQVATDSKGNPYSERLGQMTGVGWYVQASAWPFGDTFINGDPGFYRPVTMNLQKEQDKPRRGLEVAVRVGGVNAEYNGNARGGAADSRTASKDTGAGTKINVFEYAFGVNYWYTKYIRAAVNYTLYHTPDSGSANNRAAVPGNLGSNPDKNDHLLHELGARIAVWF
jgi:hypothetical protein